MRRDVAFVYVAYAARMAAPLMLIPLYGRVLGPHVYGVLLAAISLGQLVWAICDWGLPFSGTRGVASADSDTERSRLLHQHLLARAILFAAAGPLCLLLGLWSPLLGGDIPTVIWGIVFGGISATNLTWYFQGIERYREPAYIELLGIVLSTGLIIATLAVFPRAWVVPCILSLVGAAMSILSYLRVRPRSSATPIALRDGVRAIRESTHLFAYRASLVLLMPTTTLAAGYLLAPAAAAQYAIVDKLITTAGAMLTPLSQVFVGSVNASVASNQNQPEVYFRQMRRLVFVMTAAASCIAGTLALTSHWLLEFVFGSGFVNLASYLSVCAAVIPLALLASTLVSYVLVPLQRDALASVTGIFALLSNIALFALGCVWLGIWGACIARTVAGALRVSVVALALRRAGVLDRVIAGR